MENEELILCVSSAYDKKYYFNERYDKLIQDVKDEIKAMSVLFTEDVGGILIIKFDEDGSLLLQTEADEGDLLYDDIGATLKVRHLQVEKAELFASIELFYKVFFLGEEIE